MSVEVAIAVIVLAALLAGFAFVLYSRRLITDPSHYARLMEEATRQESQSNLPKARKLYRRVISGTDRIPDATATLIDTQGRALLLLGHVEEQLGHAEASLFSFHRAARLIDVPSEIIRTVAEGYAARHDVSSEALDCYVRYVSLPGLQDCQSNTVISLLESQCRLYERSLDHLDECTRLSRRIATGAPDLGWAHYHAGVTLGLSGKHIEAIDELIRAESLMPDRADVSLQLGKEYLSVSEHDKALEALRRAVSKDAGNDEAFHLIAQMILERPNKAAGQDEQCLTEALTAARTACTLQPARADYWHLLSQVELLTQHQDLAGAALDEAIKLEPQNTVFMMERANVYLEGADRAHAITILRKIVALDPMQISARLLLANQLLLQREYSEAEEHFRKSLESTPDNPEVREGLGRALFHRGRPPEAIQELKQAGTLSQAGLYALGRCYGQAGMVEKAIRSYEAWLTAHGMDPDVLFYLGSAYCQKGDWAKGATFFQQAEESARQQGEYSADATYLRGVALAQLGEFDAAEATYHTAEALRPDDPRIPYSTGNLAAIRQRFATAQEAFNRAIRIKPDFPEAHFGLGIAEEAQGSVKDAISDYSECLRLKPDWPEAQLRLGVATAKSGDYELAMPL
ncbi:MAG: tetratricopeptide repeat protein, partial [Chloroflexi bacterium]|nr:tetratricopeptide repeat protein [Chloroflexota bacterium]